MPAIIGSYGVSPADGVTAGVWVALTDGGLVGVANSDLPHLDPSWDLPTASAEATAYAQAIVGPSVQVLVTGITLAPWTYVFSLGSPGDVMLPPDGGG
jgi:hypothetical protein